MQLEDLGWSAWFAGRYSSFAGPGREPARVAAVHGRAYDVLSAVTTQRAETSGRLCHLAGVPADLPAAGDWVVLDHRGGRPLITAVLERRTVFSRKVAWTRTEEQVLAANVDLALVVAAAPALNLRSLERYLTAAAESGAEALVVITKIDLATPPDLSRLNAPVVAVSSVTGAGLAALRARFERGATGALLGPSGTGKTTLTNRLLGGDQLATREVRRDGKGRHTTAHRELHLLPGGGLLLDTPGLRELQLWETDRGLESAFADIDSLAAKCRFRDCAHRAEPGCAVRAAIERGDLDADRLRSYLKLERELAGLERRVSTLPEARRAGMPARGAERARIRQARRPLPPRAPR